SLAKPFVFNLRIRAYGAAQSVLQIPNARGGISILMREASQPSTVREGVIPESEYVEQPRWKRKPARTLSRPVL
ncbi:MAG: hypothetical protein ACRD2G_10540, partial [Terriglobia bacterium]